VTLRVDRLLDAFRLAVQGVVLTVGLTMLFGVWSVAGWWLWGVLAMLGSVGALVLLFRSPRCRSAIASALDWVVGRPG
jgi:hypothetical protein